MHRIVFAGAGSYQFAPALLSDIVKNERLSDITLALHDIDEARLARTYGLAERMRPHARCALKVEATLDPDEALTGADFLIMSIELDRFDTWQRDREVPAMLGISQALGENGGPGGMFHALRMIPGAIALARRVQKLCPDALVLNLSNPLSRICQAIADTTSVKLVGLCHEIHGGRAAICELFGLSPEQLVVEAAGVNHFTWFTKLETRDGRDLYPELLRLARQEPDRYLLDDRLLVGEILRATDLVCVTNDSHAGEYLRFGHITRCAWAPGRLPEPFFRNYVRDVNATGARIERIVSGEEDVLALLEEESGEEVIPIIEHIIRGETWRSDAINLVNHDELIPELPRWSIVEVPGSIDASGGRGQVVDRLPHWVLAMCNLQVRIHKLTVEAALNGDRKAAIEALMIDPTVPDIENAERVFDALLEAHRPYLPRFA